jgi:nicotinate-nucleotide pyrophosphorylase (carboxylating)
MDVLHPEIVDAVRRALAEDIGSGDITTNLCVPADARATGRMLVQQNLTLAGIELLPLIFPDCDVQLRHPSGAYLESGAEVALVTGPARSLLTGERTALNFVQRLSGIATLAAAYVKAVEGTGCKILDTRKTTPGLRRLEKMAAAAGGATNHRMGLYDAVLIKNNHIAAAGGVRAALERTGDAQVPVEIEVRTRAELDEALACGAKHLLLDNLTPSEAREWIVHIAERTSPENRPTVELSGGIRLDTVQAFAETGADFVSCGAVTHSAPAADLNFRLDLE